jgi:hypothetical protein
MTNSAFTPTVLQDFAEASVSQSGIVTTGAQSFAGAKIFTGRISSGNSKVRAYLTGNTTITTGTDTEIVFNNDSTSGLGWDTNGEFNTANGRFTPTKAGYYQVNVMMQHSGPGDGKYAAIFIYRNGIGGNRFAVAADQSGSVSSDVSLSCSGLIYCNGTSDYISAFANHNKGSDATIYGGSESTAITILEVV